MSDAEEPTSTPRPQQTRDAGQDGPGQDGQQQDGPQQDPADDTVLGGAMTRPISHDTQSGEADYVATNAGGVSAEPGNPLPEDEQGRGAEYDPVDQGPQQEG